MRFRLPRYDLWINYTWFPVTGTWKIHPRLIREDGTQFRIFMGAGVRFMGLGIGVTHR